MKVFPFFLLCLAISLTSCVSAPAKPTNHPTTKVQKDEDGEWDLTVFDSDFDYFLSTRAMPKSQFTESYLKSRNQQLVTEWNSLYNSGRYRNVIESSIDYDPNEKYGFDFEYKLFQVFVYTNWKYRVPFMSLPSSQRVR